MAKVTVFGIKNCGSVKKALSYYQGEGEEVLLHDYDKDGLTAELVKAIFKDNGAKLAINTRGPSYRNLPDDLKAQLASLVEANASELDDSQLEIILNHNRVLKRPVVYKGSKYLVEDVKSYK